MLTEDLVNLVVQHKKEIEHDYNEASFLYPFWQNSPPDDRGRAPRGDQTPWIEVGEHAIGSKLSRMLAKDYLIKDSGLPTGADQRFVLTSPKLGIATGGYTDSAWLFVDIKSVGPRDDQDHTVMSHNQVSGDGIWEEEEAGVENTPMIARGARASHPFHCSVPPLFVLSTGEVAPTVILALKPVYKMLPNERTAKNSGQPIERIDIACIPNGLLLTCNPKYLEKYPSLLFPGKDDKGKDPRKVRARVGFEPLRQIDQWRHQKIPF